MRSIAKKSKKKVIIASIAAGVIVLAAGIGVFAISQANRSNNPADTQQTTNPSSADKPAQEVNPTQPDKDQGKTPIQNEAPTTQPPSSNSSGIVSVGVNITASSQNGSVYQIRALIETVSDSGTCTLKLTQGSKVVTKTAGVQALAKSSTCQGFDVPVSELASGSWQLSLSYSNSNVAGSTTSTITVQ